MEIKMGHPVKLFVTRRNNFFNITRSSVDKQYKAIRIFLNFLYHANKLKLSIPQVGSLIVYFIKIFMQPTTQELEKKYNEMRDDQILSLLDDEGMREDALEVLEKIAKKRWLLITKKIKQDLKTNQVIDNIPQEKPSDKVIKTINTFWWSLIIRGIMLTLWWILYLATWATKIKAYLLLTSTNDSLIIIFLTVYWILLILNWIIIKKNKEKNLFAYIKNTFYCVLFLWIVESWWMQKMSFNLLFSVAIFWALYFNHPTWKFLVTNTSPERIKSINLYILWGLSILSIFLY